jgi:actin-related protein
VVQAPDGVQFELRIDRERFYATEVLFSPSLLEQTAGQLGLPALVAKAANAIEVSARQEICSYIVVVGGSARLPGLAARLKEELLAAGDLLSCGVAGFQVHCLEQVSPPPLGGGGGGGSGKEAEAEADRLSVTWKGAAVRMKASLNRYHSAANVEVADDGLWFKEQEFIVASEYQQHGPLVVERLLDDCY